MSEETEFRETFFAQYSPAQFQSWDREMTYLYCYRGSATEAPVWVDMAPSTSLLIVGLLSTMI